MCLHRHLWSSFVIQNWVRISQATDLAPPADQKSLTVPSKSSPASGPPVACRDLSAFCINSSFSRSSRLTSLRGQSARAALSHPVHLHMWT